MDKYIYEERIEYMEGTSFEASLIRVGRIYPHFHSKDMEIVYCLEGEVSFVSANEKSTLAAGEVYSFDYEDIHYLYSDKDNVCLIIHLDLKNMHIPWEKLEHAYMALESRHCHPYQVDAMRKLKDEFLSLSMQYFSGETGFSTASILDILTEYFSWYSYDNQDYRSSDELYDRFYTVLSYCIDNLETKISAYKLAEMAHINSNYFSQFFMGTVYGNFSSMIKYFRCHRAEMLLLTTDMSNVDISFKCGFSDVKRFYAAFRKMWGSTPFEHRKAYMEYMELPMESTVIGNEDAIAILTKQIVKWHIEKTRR